MVVLQLGDPAIVKGLRPTIVPGGIPIESFQWGTANSVTSSSSGGNKNRATIQDAVFFAKGENVNATDIVRLSVNGTGIPVAKVSVMSNATASSSGFQVILSDVIVSSVSTFGIDVTFTLNFRGSEQRFMMMR